MNDSYNSVMGENFKNDVTALKTLKNKTIPAGRKLCDALALISPKTQEVQDLHEKLIEVENTAFNGYLLAVTAIEKQDRELAIKANEKFNESRKLTNQFLAAVAELKKQHNVVDK